MRPPRLRSWVLAGAFVVLGTAVALLRQSGGHVWDTVWAEDGRLYTSDALSHPFLATLGRGYNGYIQVLPRLLAGGTRLVPVSRIATYLAVSAALVTSLLGLVVIRSSGGWIRSMPLRICVGAMTVAAPVAFFEVNANLANLGWPLLIASFWALASRHEGRGDLAVRIAVVALTALSTSVAIVLLPWALVVVALRRRRADLAVGGAFLIALVVQGLADASTPAATAPGGWQLGYVAKAFAARGLGSLAIGERWIPDLWLHHPHLLVLGATAFVVLLAVVAVVATPTADRPSRPWARGGRDEPGQARAGLVTRIWAWWRSLRLDRWWVAGASIVLAAVTYLSTTWIRGATTIGLTTLGHFDQGGSRYLYVPVVLLFGALAMLVDGAGRRWLEAAFVLWVVVVMASSLRLPTLRSDGPSWAAGVQSARATCRTHPERAAVAVPTSPGPGWYVSVPCADLR